MAGWHQGEHPDPRLSVLDLVPVRSGQSSTQAVRASLDLVRLADRLGYERYWFAEHHNMPAVAASTPPVMIAAAASVTDRIRVGSGGVMLPNHAPLVVAEQFAALEAIAPDGSTSAWAVRPARTRWSPSCCASPAPRPTSTASPARDGHPRAHEPAGRDAAPHERAGLRRARDARRGRHPDGLAARVERLLRAPRRRAGPAVRVREPLLGPGHRRDPRPLPRGLPPERGLPEPRTFLTLNAVVAETDDEARARALPRPA